MRSGAIAAIFAAGCGFSAGGASDGAPATDTPAADARTPDGAHGLDAAPVATACDDTALRLCVDFEDPQPFTDKSASAVAVDQFSMVTATTRLVNATTDEGAGHFIDASKFTFAESGALDIADKVTLDAWISPLMLPEDMQHGYIVENNTQFSASYGHDQKLHCNVFFPGVAFPLSVASNIAIPTGATFHHVACAYDGAMLRAYVDGTLTGCIPGAGALRTDGTKGTVVGGNLDTTGPIKEKFIGNLDNVRVFARALSDAEVCAAAGQSGCPAVCPGL